MRPSVALVYTASVLEMFKTNIRESIRLKINNENIIEILLLFNGERPLHEILGIANIQDTMKESFLSLLKYLVEKNILIHIDIPYRTEWLDSYARVLLMIEEYYTSTSRVAHAFNNLQRSVVFIAGLGTVGTWVAKSLAMSGVKKFILVDPDIVDMSNLHRQELFFESDIGLLKVDVASERLSEIDSSIVIEKVNESLDSSFFERHNLKLFDLAINCADNPTVDETSRIVGKFCMANKIPHIIGGGYNLHLTLVGQSVIPFQTACVMCFENALKKLNDLELFDVKKLYRPNRKIGSFGPLCAVTASITATEAFKILIGATEYLAMINKRKEFRLQNMDFYEQEILPNPNCEWCGSHGIFVKSE
jgi:molybdopterin/thiamine biosynthesis adenylyltransferase